jgi:hypothetical protein
VHCISMVRFFILINGSIFGFFSSLCALKTRGFVVSIIVRGCYGGAE